MKRQSDGRVKRYVVAVLLLLLAGIVFWPAPREVRFDHGPRSLLKKRPAHVNLARVDEWSLFLDGQPFADGHHVIRLEETVHFTGHMFPNTSAIPPGAEPELRVSLRPVALGGVHENWDVVDGVRRGEWLSPLLGFQGLIDDTNTVDGQRFAPGEYNARLYMIVNDDDAGENSVDLLATATVTIVASDP